MIHIISEDLFKLIWPKKTSIFFVCMCVFVCPSKLCLWGENLFLLIFTCIVEDYRLLELSPIFLVRNKSVRFIRQDMFAGTLAVQSKNTGNNIQREY